MDQIEKQQQSSRKEFYAQQSRRKWTQEEDNICMKVVEDEMNKNDGNMDGIDWGLVEKALNGTRNIRQCKERWRLRLDPNINKEPWTATDDQILLQLQAQLGNQWITICKRFPGRSDHACKCRWMALMREKKRNGKLRSDSTSILLPSGVEQPALTHARSSSNPLSSIGGLTNNGSSMSGNSGSISNRGSGSMSLSRSTKSRNGNNGSGTNESDSFPTTSDTSASAQLDGSDAQKSSSLMSRMSDNPKEDEEDEKSSSSDSGDQSGGSGSGSGSNLESISKRRRLSEDGTLTEDLGNDSNVNISNNLNNHFSSNNSGSQATAQAQIFSGIGNRKGDHDINNNNNITSNGNNNNQHSSSSTTSGNVSSSSLNSNSNATQVPAFMGVNLGMGNGINPMLFNGQFMSFPQMQPVNNLTQNQQFSLGATAPMMVVPLSSLPQTQFANNTNAGPYVLVPATSIVTPLGGINQQLSNSPGYLIPMIAIPGSTMPSTPSANMGMQILQMPNGSTTATTCNLSSPHQSTLATSLPSTLGSPTGNGKNQSSTSASAPTIPFVFPSFSQFTAAASLSNNNNNSSNNHNNTNKRGSSR